LDKERYYLWAQNLLSFEYPGPLLCFLPPLSVCFLRNIARMEEEETPTGQWDVAQEIRKKRLELVLLKSMQGGEVKKVQHLLDTVKTYTKVDKKSTCRILKILSKYLFLSKKKIIRWLS
jgi:hypothetical protein